MPGTPALLGSSPTVAALSVVAVAFWPTRLLRGAFSRRPKVAYVGALASSVSEARGMSAAQRCSKSASPTCIRPVINSVASRPLVTKKGLLWSPPGLLISMRLLSKYWTMRWPPGAFLYDSVVAPPGMGPQYQERLAWPAATG